MNIRKDTYMKLNPTDTNMNGNKIRLKNYVMGKTVSYLVFH
jgi:hypothetical protein